MGEGPLRCPPNLGGALLAGARRIRVSDRMPVILAPSPGGSPRSPTRGDLMRPLPANLMRMWPISTSVNKPENDDSSIVEPIELDCGIICWVNRKTQCLKSRICGTSESSVEFPMLCLNVGHQGRPRGDLWSRD